MAEWRKGGKAERKMLRLAIAHPCATAQQPGRKAERQKGRKAERQKGRKAEKAWKKGKKVD